MLWAQLSSCALPGPQIGTPRHIGLDIAHQAGEFDRDVHHLGAGIWHLIAASSHEPLSDLDKHCLATFGQGYEDAGPTPREQEALVNDRNTLIRLLDTTDRAVQEAERFWCFMLSFEGLRLWGELFAQMRQGYLFDYVDALEDAE